MKKGRKAQRGERENQTLDQLTKTKDRDTNDKNRIMSVIFSWNFPIESSVGCRSFLSSSRSLASFFLRTAAASICLKFCFVRVCGFLLRHGLKG